MARLYMPAFLDRRLDAAARTLLQAPDSPPADFRQPPGETALVPADSVSWRIFKNPIALFIGGVAAVILELAEPAVRSGVWEHSSFRTDPLRRLRRTGLAAMITVYGARSTAEAMIAGVVRMHARVEGVTPGGKPYHANDRKLLTWVQATAGFGFIGAYHHYVHQLTAHELDSALAESAPAARLYGAVDAPTSDAEWQALVAAMRGRLEASPIIFEFLDIMRRTPIVPGLPRAFQWMLIRAAVELTPPWLRAELGLTRTYRLRRWERPVVRAAGMLADRIMLRSGPAAQACLRLGLPADFLFRRPG